MACEKRARLGRRESPYLNGMGATEDDGGRRFAAASGDGEYCLKGHYRDAAGAVPFSRLSPVSGAKK